jgi:hypothetical protein
MVLDQGLPRRPDRIQGTARRFCDGSQPHGLDRLLIKPAHGGQVDAGTTADNS